MILSFCIQEIKILSLIELLVMVRCKLLLGPKERTFFCNSNSCKSSCVVPDSRDHVTQSLNLGVLQKSSSWVSLFSETASRFSFSADLVIHQCDKILDFDLLGKLDSYYVCFTVDNEILNDFCFGQNFFVATSHRTGQC